MPLPAPSLVSKFIFNSKPGEQLPYDARRDAQYATDTPQKKSSAASRVLGRQ
jgi:hypothetical protein